MRKPLLMALLLGCAASAAGEAPRKKPATVASWYGEEHRGKLMANGHRFDPDKMTAASWFYPLGTQVKVTVNSSVYRNSTPPSVLVTMSILFAQQQFHEIAPPIDYSLVPAWLIFLATFSALVLSVAPFGSCSTNGNLPFHQKRRARLRWKNWNGSMSKSRLPIHISSAFASRIFCGAM